MKAMTKTLKLKLEVRKIETTSTPKSIVKGDIKESVHNLNQLKQGKLKAEPARELLNEL